MRVTNYEKETIILFNEEEPTARVETFNGRIIREAEKAATRSSDVVCEEREADYGVYTMPKTFVKIRVGSAAEKAKVQKMVEAKRLKKLSEPF